MSKQICKYMVASERDSLWGLTVTTIGYEEIMPGDEYPTHGHADGYYFNLDRGRELNEYQLLYNPEGRGVFHSRTVKEIGGVRILPFTQSKITGKFVHFLVDAIRNNQKLFLTLQHRNNVYPKVLYMFG